MRQIAEEVLAAVGGKGNVTANDICMTRLRILTEDPSLVDTNMLASAQGVLGFVRRGTNGLEVVFGPGKAEAVQEELVSLTGIEPSDEVFDALKGAPASALNVHIAPNPLRRAADAQRTGRQKAALQLEKDDEADVSELMSMLDKMGPAGEKTLSDEPHAAEDGGGSRARVLVINGPNINMLGIREPDIYGHDTYRALLKTCRESALEAGFSECSCFQSNHEGDLVDAIQDAYDDYDGIVINPGAYTHTSVAILDAAKAVALPMVEVHISKIDEREEFRQVSYIRAACFETIAGMGIEGYRKALFDLAKEIGL